MSRYILKIVKDGAGIDTADIREMVMHSDYTMLKYHMDTEGEITLNGGDTHQYVDFTHNLGYTPAFIAYIKDIDGKEYFIPSIPRAIGYSSHAYAYSDATKVRCGYVFDTGAYNQIKRTLWDFAYTDSGDYYALCGNESGNSRNCLFRFDDIGAGISDTVTLTQGATISSANLEFYMQEVGDTGSDMKIITYGIDEDDTDVTTDMGRSKTSASTSQNVAAGTVGERFGINVTSQVQEIVNRASWANGNNMGFYVLDNGSPNNIWRKDAMALPDSWLTINISGSATLKFRVIIFKDKIA